MDDEKARCHVVIHGRVQGVFFRMNTANAAARTGVAGWVRNRPEGTVEAVFEGERRKIEEIIQWCRVGDPPARVEEIDLSWETPTGEFAGFDITY